LNGLGYGWLFFYFGYLYGLLAFWVGERVVILVEELEVEGVGGFLREVEGEFSINSGCFRFTSKSILDFFYISSISSDCISYI
jgi:hypothetical protein